VSASAKSQRSAAKRDSFSGGASRHASRRENHDAITSTQRARRECGTSATGQRERRERDRRNPQRNSSEPRGRRERQQRMTIAPRVTTPATRPRGTEAVDGRRCEAAAASAAKWATVGVPARTAVADSCSSSISSAPIDKKPSRQSYAQPSSDREVAENRPGEPPCLDRGVSVA